MHDICVVWHVRVVQVWFKKIILVRLKVGEPDRYELGTIRWNPRGRCGSDRVPGDFCSWSNPKRTGHILTASNANLSLSE